MGSSGLGLGGNLLLYDEPFRHCVIDGFIDADTVRKINAEWPTSYTLKEDGSFQKKWSTTETPPTARKVIDSIPVDVVERATGLSGLFVDPRLTGGGLHCIPRHGFLNMHVDFNVHPEHGWRRRANLLIYLNEDWRDEWRGHLVLGKNSEKRIAPIAGRCVIFETNESSWHGHPEPLKCPDSRQRRSLAVYYYSDSKPEEKEHSTVYIK